MPPSDSAIFSSGNRTQAPDHSQSAVARNAFIGNSVGNSSNGGSYDGNGAQADEPVCRQMTVSVSAQALRNGSQWPVCRLGSCRCTGNSAKLTALKPRS